MSYIEAVSKKSEALQAQTPVWMHPIQQRGRALWKAQGWPGKKTEAWRYTNLSKLERANVFDVVQEQVKCDLAAVVEERAIPFAEGKRIVVIDGIYSSELSGKDLPEGLTITAFSNLDDIKARRLAKRLGSLVDADKHFFMAQSESLLQDGLYIQVAENVEIKEPIYVLNINSDSVSNSNFRLYVELAANAKLNLLEHFICANESEEKDSLVLACTEFDLADGAMLDHHRLNMHAESCIHLSGVHTSLKSNSTLNSFYLALGTQLSRIDASVKHLGEGAHTNMHGAYLPRFSQHVDIHTNLEHCVPNTTSNEVFRGIIADSARAVFNGRIHIHPQAQKTNAQLSNKNLLTSNKAEVDTKPELEIYANDVQCAHGATIAQLNEQSLHYLRTRGIGEDEARVMLSFGFINELIDKIKLAPVKDFLRPLLAKRFSRDDKLTRHLL